MRVCKCVFVLLFCAFLFVCVIVLCFFVCAIVMCLFVCLFVPLFCAFSFVCAIVLCFFVCLCNCSLLFWGGGVRGCLLVCFSIDTSKARFFSVLCVWLDSFFYLESWFGVRWNCLYVFFFLPLCLSLYVSCLLLLSFSCSFDVVYACSFAFECLRVACQHKQP